jgi:uncharacterized protein
MACSYCNFGSESASADTLDEQLAVRAIDWMAELAASEGRPTLDVHLFGGEPLQAGRLLDIVVHRTRLAAAERDLEPVLEIATNGVCSESRARFIGEYFQTVSLSLDGPREIHDRHRVFPDGRASFSAVERTARILANSACELILRACVTEESTEAMAETAAWMAREFQPNAIDFEPLRTECNTLNGALCTPDPYRFASWFYKAQRSAAQWGVNVSYSAAMRKETRICFCPIGSDAAIIETNGEVNACYLEKSTWQGLGMDLTLGQVSAGAGLEIDETMVTNVRDGAVPQPRCAGCFCRYWCAGGCHVSRAAVSGLERDRLCELTRLVTAVSLLDDLGESEAIAEILANSAAMGRLVLQASDLVQEVELPA